MNDDDDFGPTTTLAEAFARMLANIEAHRAGVHASVDAEFDGYVALVHRDHEALKAALARGSEPEPGADISAFICAKALQ
jgi:hypothetical protein